MCVAKRKLFCPVGEVIRPIKLLGQREPGTHLQLGLLVWMNTGLDNREARERDRQGQGNGERLFSNGILSFLLDENDFFGLKVDYRYFYGIFVFMYHFKCLNTF